MFKTYLTMSLAMAIAIVWTASTISAYPYQDAETTTIQGPSSPATGYSTARDLYIQSPSPRLILPGQSRSPFDRRNRRANPMDEAIGAMKEAESDAERREAEGKVREILVEQYQAFLVENEKQIEQLQKRLDDLKTQLNRRRQAQEKMVDLEMTRVINESEGLVWPNRSGRRGGGSIWLDPTPSSPSFPPRSAPTAPARVNGGR